MKKLLSLSLVLSVAALLSGCGCYKKMSKNSDQIQAKCNPEVLYLKGNNVTADLTVTFPPKYFDDMAVLKITPVLVFQNGEITGTPKFVQGEKVKDNFTVISWKDGGSYTQTLNFPYDERAKISTLVLRIEAKCNDNCHEKYNDYLPLNPERGDVAVARGISTLQNNARETDYLALMADNYKRIRTTTKEAQIMYEISRSNVRPAELTKDQVKLFESFVKENSGLTVYSKGYASPDGPVDLNDKLSKERGQSAKDAVSKNLKGVNANYDVAAYGEDWDGFKALVEQSNIKDKALILQVLQMYDNPVKRDQEIKNMSEVFDVLAKDILPQLRRSKLEATVDIKGLSDADLLKAAKGSDISTLTIEELLYAATLTQDDAEKIKIYTYAGDKFNDARAYNNLAVSLTRMGQYADAKKYLQKAAALKSSPEINNNLGVVALAQGNVAEAKKYLSSLNTPEAQANMGLVNLAEGNYAAAQKTLKGYDLALAEVLNGNLAAASAVLTGDTSAEGDYLRAVIASRQGNSAGVIANLKSAIAKKPALRQQAQNDIEFVKYFDNAEFRAL